jgi:hypothetical protein
MDEAHGKNGMQVQRSVTPESASEPESEPTPEPEVQQELSAEQEAQAQADVRVMLFFVSTADNAQDARKTTGSTRQAPRSQAEEAYVDSECECTGQQKAFRARTGEQRQCWVQKHGCTSRV